MSVSLNPPHPLAAWSMADAELQVARHELTRDAENAVARARRICADAGIDVESEVIQPSRQGGYTANALLDAGAQWKAGICSSSVRVSITACCAGSKEHYRNTSLRRRLAHVSSADRVIASARHYIGSGFERCARYRPVYRRLQHLVVQHFPLEQ